VAKPQVNVLLTQDERDVLEALAFVNEATASELLRPVVTGFLDRQGNDPDVREALAALRKRRSRKRR
jgi:hypothetical protein